MRSTRWEHDGDPRILARVRFSEVQTRVAPQHCSGSTTANVGKIQHFWNEIAEQPNSLAAFLHGQGHDGTKSETQ